MTFFYYGAPGRKIPRSFDKSEVEFKSFYPKPTKDEIAAKQITRYFIRQANHRVGEIAEVNKGTYERLKNNPFYRSLSLVWRISGKLDDVPGLPDKNTPTRLFTGVLTANRLSLELAEEQMPGISDHLPNLTQFYVDDR